MRLDLRDIIHVPDARKTFRFQLDLSGQDFYGSKPIVRPVDIQGSVTNHAGALVLEGTARSVLELACDRCGKSFSREKTVFYRCMLAESLENGENDEIELLENGKIDLDDLARTVFILEMDTKTLCSEDCKGLCPRCGADLNLGPCSCKKEIDPRLAVLAKLLENK